MPLEQSSRGVALAFEKLGWTTFGDPEVWKRKAVTKLCGEGEDTPFAAGILRLWFEAHINTVSDFRQQFESREDLSNKISQPEGEARKTRLGERLALAIKIEGMPPRHHPWKSASSTSSCQPCRGCTSVAPSEGDVLQEARAGMPSKPLVASAENG